MENKAAIVLDRPATIDFQRRGRAVGAGDAQLLGHLAEVEAVDRLVEHQAHGVLFIVLAQIDDAVIERLVGQRGHGDQQLSLIGRVCIVAVAGVHVRHLGVQILGLVRD